MAKAKAVPKKDSLDLLAEGDPKKIIALLLWRDRFRNPEMSAHVTLEDLDGFEQCSDYLGVTTQVSIFRPQGRPAQEAVATTPGKRGIAARAAEPPRDYVFVGVVDKDGNSIKPIESTEENADRRDAANALRSSREKGPRLAALLRGACQSGTYSTAEIQEAAQALEVLARG